MNITATQLLSSGNAIANSNIGKGLIRLLDDSKGFLLIVGIAICVAATVYLFAKKAVASEHEQVEIQKRIKAVLYSAVGIVAASSIIALVTSYFQ